jgi:predicted small lipoprotein YifL
MKQIAWVFIACAAGLAAGCGQKGALFLPDKNASVVTRPGGGGAAAPATAPAPDGAPAAPVQPKDKSGDDSTGATAPK